MILTGLWCSRDKPTMNTFLKPLVESADKLYSQGKINSYRLHNKMKVAMFSYIKPYLDQFTTTVFKVNDANSHN